MKILSREELRNHLKNSEIAPMYLLFGAERYLRNLAAKAITEKVLKDSPLREFNETDISLNDTDFVQAISSAEQMPMIAPRRVVKITEINKLKEADEPALSHYLARPAEFSVVIFIADELDKRRTFAKTMLEACVSVEFKNLEDADLIQWARVKLKELGSQADDKVLRQLVGLVGNNVLRLTNEIEKLSAAALPETLITHELIESLVPNSREFDNFTLTDYMLEKKREPALRILRKILDDGAEPLMLLGLIASNFRKLYLAKELLRQGIDRKEIERAIKMPYQKVSSFLATAARIDGEKLSRSLQRIADSDLAIKTSRGTPRLQIEMLVAELSA